MGKYSKYKILKQKYNKYINIDKYNKYIKHIKIKSYIVLMVKYLNLFIF